MKSLIAISAGLLMSVLSFANAQVFVANDTTFNYPVYNDVIIGYASQSDFDNRANSTSPTINLVPGGYLWLDVSLYNRSTLKLNDGTVDGTLTAYDNSAIVQTGGTVSDLMFCTDNSRIFIAGGHSGNLVIASGDSQITMTAGQINSALVALDRSVVNLSGGSVPQINALEESQINVYGNDLSKTLVNPNISGTSQYTLTGFLEDGTNIAGLTVFLQNNSGARLNIFNTIAVPEASTLTVFASLFVVNGVSLLPKRQKQSKG